MQTAFSNVRRRPSLANKRPKPGVGFPIAKSTAWDLRAVAFDIPQHSETKRREPNAGH
jgi:hypothetical protein